MKNPKFELKRYSESHNRANNMGENLEGYIKDIFADTVDITDENIRNQKLSEVFSYLGNQNNPPDSMLRGGDAIEVKKIESNDSSLALNSSYPKAKSYSDSPMIKQACRTCENWTVKDMIYAVGVVDDNNLKSLAFVYGDDYCADKLIYEQIKTVLLNCVDITGIYEKYKAKDSWEYGFGEEGFVIAKGETIETTKLDYNPNRGRMYLEVEEFKEKILPYLVEICSQE